jgi:hypothetical protein
MSKPDFKGMNCKELHAYVLTHREDKEAFHEYVDKLHAEATWIEMPALELPEDLDNYPEFIERVSKTRSHDEDI